MTLKRLHHISLIESRGTRCAWVRMTDNRRQHSRSFSYLKHGGKEEAIVAAMAWRDTLGKRIYGDFWPCTHSQPRSCVASNNTSGITGVSYNQRDRAWVAHWMEKEGEAMLQRTRSFSDSVWGTRQAKKDAVACRKAALEQMLVERDRS